MSPEKVQRAQELIFKDPGQSIRKLSSDIGVSEKKIRIGEENLRYKSYTIKVRQMISKATTIKAGFNDATQAGWTQPTKLQDESGLFEFFPINTNIYWNNRWLAYDSDNIHIV